MPLYTRVGGDDTCWTKEHHTTQPLLTQHGFHLGLARVWRGKTRVPPAGSWLRRCVTLPAYGCKQVGDFGRRTAFSAATIL